MFYNFILILITSLIAFTPSITTVEAAPPIKTERQPQVMQQAHKYPLKGRLRQKSDGYVYVKVNDNYIKELIRLINTSGKMTMPSSLTEKNGIGAHISVFYPHEIARAHINKIPELDRQYNFSLVRLESIQQQVDKNKRLWVLVVKSPELESLRKSYGMSPLLKGHEFHITIGMETIKPKRSR